MDSYQEERTLLLHLPLHWVTTDPPRHIGIMFTLGLNTSPNPLTEISDLESPEVPVTDTPIVETMPTTPPTLEVATEYQQKVTINDEITEIPGSGRYHARGLSLVVCVCVCVSPF